MDTNHASMKRNRRYLLRTVDTFEIRGPKLYIGAERKVTAVKVFKAMKSIICKINGVEGVTIPGVLLKQLELSMGDDVEMYTENGLLIIEPARQYEYSLTELLQQCDAQSTALDQDDIAWLNS